MNNARFREVFEASGLSRRLFAEKVGISKKSVDAYLAPAEAACFRNVTKSRLEFVELKLKLKLKEKTKC